MEFPVTIENASQLKAGCVRMMMRQSGRLVLVKSRQERIGRKKGTKHAKVDKAKIRFLRFAPFAHAGFLRSRLFAAIHLACSLDVGFSTTATT
jgi:hypothetical protein